MTRADRHDVVLAVALLTVGGLLTGWSLIARKIARALGDAAVRR